MGDYDLTVLDQYPIEVKEVRKVRGAMLCETEEGPLLLCEASLSQARVLVLEKIHSAMKEQGQMETDELIMNKDGSYISVTEDGTKYYLKKWFRGKECDVRKTGELLEAAKNLAKLHRILRFPEVSSGFPASDLAEEFGKHNRELKKVRTFIRKKTVKGEFETKFLECFQLMYDVAVSAEQGLLESGYEKIRREAKEQGCLIHGEYNYHNLIVIAGGEIRVVNFEHFCTDIQAADLYYFLRKVMEKHQWNSKLGAEIMRAYTAVNPLSEEEKKYLALRLSYPEKFWKCANTYYNSNKAWISTKSVEKLRVSIEQTEMKKRFLEQIFSFHLGKSSV